MKNKDKEFDHLLKTRVENINIPYEPAHWAMMEEKLNQHETTSRSTLYFIKGVEILLLVVTVWAMLLYGDRTNTHTETVTEQTTTQTKEKVYQTALQTTETQQQDVESNTHATLKKQSIPRPTVEEHKISQPIPRPSVTPPILEPQNTETGQESPPPMAELSPPPNLESTISSNHSFQNQSLIEPISTFFIENIPSATAAPSFISQTYLPNNGGDNPFGEIARLKRWGIRANASFGYNFDTYTSNAKSYNLSGTAESAGIAILYSASQNIGLETGLRIMKRNNSVSEYERDILLETNKDRYLVLANSSVLAELPINARYTFGKYKKTRFFVSFGASGFAILRSKQLWRNGSITVYSLDNTLVKDETTSALATASDIPTQQTLGLFWTSNVGCGFSHQLSKRTNLYIQPTYQQGVRGSDDKFQKINALSVLLGMEVKF